MTRLNARTEASGLKPRHRTPRGCRHSSRSCETKGGYSPYLPAAGLYSLFKDSLGPVPYMKFGDGV
ncbi:hypothetical protein SAMN05444159_5273 [Bradyrhizobium lablabi]|uniref:Uncharacterized protein n=1 Tax=Bradyrhizobium lablabi TaxID=722472 RepID=A0A1M6YN93_9BRAD|nr:hypothetical protein SAMN05444159_5273 [Bradyrhizobium lablabi]